MERITMITRMNSSRHTTRDLRTQSEATNSSDLMLVMLPLPSLSGARRRAVVSVSVSSNVSARKPRKRRDVRRRLA
jgi:hypothetical protein